LKLKYEELWITADEIEPVDYVFIPSPHAGAAYPVRVTVGPVEEHPMLMLAYRLSWHPHGEYDWWYADLEQPIHVVRPS
jgi:hypothetical protein